MRITQAALITIIGLFFLNGCASLKRNQLWQKRERGFGGRDLASC